MKLSIALIALTLSAANARNLRKATKGVTVNKKKDNKKKANKEKVNKKKCPKKTYSEQNKGAS